MIKIRFSLFATILVTIFSPLFASPVSSYEAFANAIEQGTHFTIVSNFSQCTQISGMPIGYFTPSDIMIIPANAQSSAQIATSDLHFTNVTGTPTYEYVKYVFNPDNSVNITSTTYKAQNFAPVGIPQNFTCTLNNGVQVETDS